MSLLTSATNPARTIFSRVTRMKRPGANLTENKLIHFPQTSAPATGTPLPPRTTTGKRIVSSYGRLGRGYQGGNEDVLNANGKPGMIAAPPGQVGATPLPDGTIGAAQVLGGGGNNLSAGPG